ncbi:Rab proteins geranylgeranyltransferase component A 2 [Sarcoptes scabiei]|uniref:Rab proteins geranylgeranyltransferase component A 2 n=2 Tax=Sarcoptes scabiei TaxID=52283 RepID=A0A834VAB0_SARSC|nr:Rab proteins geranylgeranyltransferase component A 2 [Sarcoptes scabiei]
MVLRLGSDSRSNEKLLQTMAKEFDDHYDVILTGTDLVSALISAAMSRIGKKILHLDSQKHYAKEWRSMKIFDLLLWKLSNRTEIEMNDQITSNECSGDPGTKSSLIMKRPNLIENIEIDFDVFEDRLRCQKFFSHLLENNCSQIFLDEFYDEFLHKFNNDLPLDQTKILLEEFKDRYSELNRIDNMFMIDLCPRLILSNEKLVKILLDSKVTRYIEFKKVSKLLTPIKMKDDSDDNEERDDLVEVPCTRSDIFRSTILSPLEKRYLMSFLEKCYKLDRNSDWFQSSINDSFTQFLHRQKNLTDKLREFIINTLLMHTDPIEVGDALKRINVFLKSFGRFCDRPYLFPLYGSEDIIQAFCRYGAVWGGVYCLGAEIQRAVIDRPSNRIESILVDGKSIKCDHLVTDYEIGQKTREPKFTNEQRISRAIILNTRSIKKMDNGDENGNLCFIHLPSNFSKNDRSVYCFETDYSSRVCPKSFYLQYFWCLSSANQTARRDLEPIVQKILALKQHSSRQQSEGNDLPEEVSGRILVSIYYNTIIIDRQSMTNANIPINVQLISSPLNEFNYEKAVEEAERIFKKIYPNEDFFPISNDENDNQTVEENFGDEESAEISEEQSSDQNQSESRRTENSV